MYLDLNICSDFSFETPPPPKVKMNAILQFLYNKFYPKNELN